MSAIVPIPNCDSAIRVATLADLPALDALQKAHHKALGYFPTKQFQGYIEMGGVLVAEADGAAVGYVIARDRYLKRDELGIIYQLCVAPEAQRSLVGASLIKAAFDRAAYGCKLFCCWCAQDLPANRFWEGLGFVPVAFRAGSSGKRRVHIFWQRRINEGDATTPWWYPCQTNSGAMREDRLVFPIPLGTHWTEVQAVALAPAEKPALEDHAPKSPRKLKTMKQKGPLTTAATGLRFGPPPTDATKSKRERAAKPKVKLDRKLVTATRELRDRYLEQVNARGGALTSQAKYDVSRALPAATPTATTVKAKPTPLLDAA